MLRLSDITITYGAAMAVRGVSLEVGPAESVAIVGPNGAGKSSLGRAVAGLLRPTRGSIKVTAGGVTESLVGKPAWAVARGGIIYVPETRSVFEGLPVLDNLMLTFATLNVPGAARRELLSQLYEEFPVLKDRGAQKAGTLSGGQRKFLAIARALLFVRAAQALAGGSARFNLLILDEPTHGLSPLAVGHIHELLSKLNAGGLSVLIIEQMASFALKLSSRGYFMRGGEVVAAGDSKELLRDPDLAGVYLGTATGQS